MRKVQLPKDLEALRPMGDELAAMVHKSVGKPPERQVFTKGWLEFVSASPVVVAKHLFRLFTAGDQALARRLSEAEARIATLEKAKAKKSKR